MDFRIFNVTFKVRKAYRCYMVNQFCHNYFPFLTRTFVKLSFSFAVNKRKLESKNYAVKLYALVKLVHCFDPRLRSFLLEHQH